MLNLNPEHLLQFGIKAVQDLAESSHYLYVSIKAYDFQCVPPHDNVQGGVSFSFQPGIAKNGASYARVLILENWMRKIEWYEHEYGQLVDQTEELLRESLEKAWMEHTGVPVRDPIGLDENDVKLGSVLVTKAVRKKLPEGEINGMLYRHSKHDWGDVGEESWAMNDKAAEASEQVKMYVKLPSTFRIHTPLGPYNPDWALVLDVEGKNHLYFVVETKGTDMLGELRDKESGKIHCAEQHFNTVADGQESPARYLAPVASLAEVIART